MLRARMGIRAHPTLTNGKTSRAKLAPSLSVAPGRPFVHLLIPSRRRPWASIYRQRLSRAPTNHDGIAAAEVFSPGAKARTRRPTQRCRDLPSEVDALRAPAS